ncbi:MAG: hypothetical protein QME32_00485 [Endomicrobiia bacterium]|nr:hypothetical protein [Endomicrobiia bacterium]
MFYKVAVAVFAAIVTLSAGVAAQNARSYERAKERANISANDVKAEFAGAPAQKKALEAASKATPAAARRQHRQHHRIKEGVKSGRITKDEAKDLIGDQKEIREMKKDARADGVVTKEERVEIQRKLNVESEKIYDEKRDEDVQKRLQQIPRNK